MIAAPIPTHTVVARVQSHHHVKMYRPLHRQISFDDEGIEAQYFSCPSSPTGNAAAGDGSGGVTTPFNFSDLNGTAVFPNGDLPSSSAAAAAAAARRQQRLKRLHVITIYFLQILYVRLRLLVYLTALLL